MTTLILLTLQGRIFRAEASVSQAELPTMQKEAGIVGYVVKTELGDIGSPVDGLTRSNEKMKVIK